MLATVEAFRAANPSKNFSSSGDALEGVRNKDINGKRVNTIGAPLNTATILRKKANTIETLQACRVTNSTLIFESLVFTWPENTTLWPCDGRIFDITSFGFLATKREDLKKNNLP